MNKLIKLVDKYDEGVVERENNLDNEDDYNLKIF